MKNRKIWMGVVLTLLCTLLMGVSVFAANTTMKNKKWVTGECGVFVDTDKDGVVDDFRSNGKAYYKKANRSRSCRKNGKKETK